MMKNASELEARPPSVHPPDPSKWKLDLSALIQVIGMIDFGDNNSKYNTADKK